MKKAKIKKAIDDIITDENLLSILGMSIGLFLMVFFGLQIFFPFPDKNKEAEAEPMAQEVVDLAVLEPDGVFLNARAVAIDEYLADYGSPASGTGGAWVAAEASTGVSASLMLAVFRQESSLGTNGSFSRTHFNGWGLHDPNRTNGELLYRWTSWQESIPAAFRIVANTWGEAKCADDLRGYCGGDAVSWKRSVEQFQADVWGRGI